MEKPKLNPNDLVVSSFPVGGAEDQGEIAATYKYTCTTDPTAQTYCFICPPITSPGDGCY